MLISEDLLLLLTDDATGKAAVDSQRLGLGLAGAVLVELVLRDRVRVERHQGLVLAGDRVVVVDQGPTGDDVLDEALRRLAARRAASPQSTLGPLAKGLVDGLRDRLVARGILRVEEGRVLGIFPTRSWPAVDGAHEDALRAGLRDVLVTGRTPTGAEASLIALLHALGVVPKQFADAGVDARTLKARAAEVSRGHVAGDAVRKAVEAINAAVMAGALAATTAATTSSS